MSKQKISTVSIDLDDLEKLQILADHMATSNKAIFHDYIMMLWELGATYEKFNVSFTYYRNTCTVEVTGKNRVGMIQPTEAILKAFEYTKDKNGKIIDLREKPKMETEEK